MMDHPYLFFVGFFTLTFTLGVWAGFNLSDWKIRWLEHRIETLKMALKLSSRR